MPVDPETYHTHEHASRMNAIHPALPSMNRCSVLKIFVLLASLLALRGSCGTCSVELSFPSAASAYGAINHGLRFQRFPVSRPTVKKARLSTVSRGRSTPPYHRGQFRGPNGFVPPRDTCFLLVLSVLKRHSGSKDPSPSRK